MLIAISGKIGSGKDTVGNIIQYLTSTRHYDKTCAESVISKDNHYYKGYSSFQTKKFADKLKDIVCLLIGCTREQLEDQDFKNKELGEEWNCYIFNNGKKEELTLNYNIAKTLSADNRIISRILTPRLLLQLLGTNCGRDIIHPNIWVNSLMSEYKSTIVGEYQGTTPENIKWEELEVYPDWIITDMRFPNEMQAVKSRDGITIRVNRAYSKEDLCKGSSPAIIDSEVSDKLRARYQTMEDLPVVEIHESETALDNADFDYTLLNDGTLEQLIVMVREILIVEKII